MRHANGLRPRVLGWAAPWFQILDNAESQACTKVVISGNGGNFVLLFNNMFRLGIK